MTRRRLHKPCTYTVALNEKLKLSSDSTNLISVVPEPDCKHLFSFQLNQTKDLSQKMHVVLRGQRSHYRSKVVKGPKGEILKSNQKYAEKHCNCALSVCFGKVMATGSLAASINLHTSKTNKQTNKRQNNTH